MYLLHVGGHMKVNLKKRFIALAMAGMMLTSNTLPAYSATETTASEASQAAESTAKGGDSSSASSEKSELGQTVRKLDGRLS